MLKDFIADFVPVHFCHKGVQREYLTWHDTNAIKSVLLIIFDISKTVIPTKAPELFMEHYFFVINKEMIQIIKPAFKWLKSWNWLNVW